MNESRIAFRVGAFVVSTIILIAVLVVVFSKGTAFYTPTYTLRLRAENVSGLKARSSVLLSGVPVGSVSSSDLSPDGRGVIIELSILRRYDIHGDARFSIEQIGFLGDQFVAVSPGRNAAPMLKDGDEVKCEEPFNIQDAARSAMGTLQRVDDAAKTLNETMIRLNNAVLTGPTLTNIAQAVGNFKALSERVRSTMDELHELVQSNRVPVSSSVSNLNLFSADMKQLGGDLREVVAENRGEVHSAITNLEATARSVESMARQLEAGRGTLGSLLRSEQLQINLSNTLARLDVATSNIANYGLLFKPKPPKSGAESRVIIPARKP